MNEKDLEMKYVVIKLDDIKYCLDYLEQRGFWRLFEKIINRKEEKQE